MSFTSVEAYLDALKICPATLVAEVRLSGVNLLASDVKIWASAEILLDSFEILTICLKKKD